MAQLATAAISCGITRVVTHALGNERNYVDKGAILYESGMGDVANHSYLDIKAILAESAGAKWQTERLIESKDYYSNFLLSQVKKYGVEAATQGYVGDKDVDFL